MNDFIVLCLGLLNGMSCETGWSCDEQKICCEHECGWFGVSSIVANVVAIKYESSEKFC